MINIRLLTVTVAAVALLCLSTGCQSRRPLYLGNNAIVLETDEGRKRETLRAMDIMAQAAILVRGTLLYRLPYCPLYYYGPAQKN